jgi:hypothetical protein
MQMLSKLAGNQGWMMMLAAVEATRTRDETTTIQYEHHQLQVCRQHQRICSNCGMSMSMALVGESPQNIFRCMNGAR